MTAEATGPGGPEEEARVRDIVVQVLQGALRSRNLEGVVLIGPACAEADLLARWLEAAVPVVEPPPSLLGELTRTLDGDPEAAALAWGAAVARRDRLLPIHPAHKSILILDAPLAPCFPLGDVWGHHLERWCGPVLLPRVLTGLPAGALHRVEDALAQGLEAGDGLAKATATLPDDLATRIVRGLGAARVATRPPLVPKLSAWTPGLDPPP